MKNFYLYVVALVGVGLMFLLNDSLQGTAKSAWAASSDKEVAQKGGFHSRSI